MQVSCCFLDHDGKFLIVARLNPRTSEYEWDLPAGIAEVNESSEATVIRTVLKETGYKAEQSDLKLLGTFELVSGGDKPYTMFAYRLKLTAPFHANQNLKSEWVNAEECLARPNLVKNLRQLLVLTGYLKSIPPPSAIINI